MDKKLLFFFFFLTAHNYIYSCIELKSKKKLSKDFFSFFYCSEQFPIAFDFPFYDSCLIYRVGQIKFYN